MKQVLRDIPYASPDGIPLSLDIHLPAGKPPFPVILYLSGGGWLQCTRQITDPWFCDHGMAVAAIDYRISRVAIAPANIHDCKAAVRWIRAHAAQYGLDGKRIGAFGGSAGGHLAALLGLSNGVKALEGTDTPERSSDVLAVCDICGPSDLTRMAIPTVAQRFAALLHVTDQYLGGPVSERLELARLVSPLTYVSKNALPMLIIHGRSDSVVSVEESIILHEAVQNAGAESVLRIHDGIDHGVPDHLYVNEVISFFRNAFALH